MMRLRLVILVFAFVGVPLLTGASCGEPPEQRPDIIPPLGAQIVTFPGNDGTRFGGTLMRNPESQRAVICLHAFSGNGSDYDPLLPALVEAGFNAMSIDLRGKRLSRGERGTDSRESDEELYRQRDSRFFEVMWLDVKAAWQYLSEVCGVDPDRVALIGAGIGSTVATITATRDPRPAALVVLSPGRDYLGIDIRTRIPLIGDPPVLVMAAERATGQLDAADLFRSCRSDSPLSDLRIQAVDGNYDEAHGTRMFTRPGVIRDIVRFLDRAVR